MGQKGRRRREEGEKEKMHTYIITFTAEKQTKKHLCTKELDGSVGKPASFHPMVQPNRKHDDENPLRDRFKL